MEVEYIIRNRSDEYPQDAVMVPQKEHLDSTGRLLAEKAALHYFNDGGYEASWPVTFDIYIDGDLDGRYEIEQEAVPVFYAKKL